MKRNVGIMALLFIMSSLSMKLVAQENLNALVKKCETMSSVDVNVVSERNAQTNKLEPKVINITIKNDQALVNEFLDAFKKDKENAKQVIENKRAGKTNYSFFYQFEGVAYSFNSNENNEGDASISVLY